MVTKKTMVLSGVTTMIALIILISSLVPASIDGDFPMSQETPTRGGPDTDSDNVPEDGHDKCLNTPPGQEVDQNGCSQEQFCLPFGCSSACFEADWLGDEPNSTNPQDCTAIITSIYQNGLFYEPVCVPLVCEEPEEPPVPTEKMMDMIPEGNVTVWLRPGTDSYFVTELSNVPLMPQNLSQINNSNYTGWCLERDVPVGTNHPYNATLFSSYDENLTDWCPECADYNLDLVNYIINHKPDGATYEQIQNAIWYFTVDDGQMPADPLTRDVIEEAMELGPGFRPRPGEFFAVIIFINDANQLTFIEVDP